MGFFSLFLFSSLHADTFLSLFQVCCNGTRVFVQKEILDKFTEQVVQQTQRIKIGDPLLEGTRMGPLINRPHLERVLGFVKGAKEQVRKGTGGWAGARRGECSSSHHQAQALPEAGPPPIARGVWARVPLCPCDGATESVCLGLQVGVAHVTESMHPVFLFGRGLRCCVGETHTYPKIPS